MNGEPKESNRKKLQKETKNFLDHILHGKMFENNIREE